MMLGWMTEDEAISEGFTHYGSYFGIPIYLGDPDSEDLLVAAKHEWLEPVMTLFHYIEGFIAGVFYPEEEPAFQFLVKGKIEAKKNK